MKTIPAMEIACKQCFTSITDAFNALGKILKLFNNIKAMNPKTNHGSGNLLNLVFCDD
ncbi:hypothetical protein RintRC_1183 [Richelia intracellularis]|nr:hypothetical protein RintRC_1183 [Richelia intracellularis]